ncbi:MULTISPECIES: pirin family protein [Calothrix]|uniref:Pirin family protein n=2 Tax=Calothrix TaxID=1186 RepID=A0ABR8AA65_9CYAN|nr:MULTISPECIES: pirin family protein [Calothrix]MBD2196163.1 pirin family protein [Calothrix parietina FACHB-288]MBD2224816.1 pirin family protein [Calothrix anomala FACHB-343]
MSQNTKTLVVHDGRSRGHTKISWLDSYHTFSFGNFYDPNYMGFRSLRVINDDTVIPGAGFGTHGHRDMEILTYVLSGALEHKDSLGTGSVIRPGDAQIMSAGTGITHSEYNHSQTESVHFLQIWMLPNELGLKPRYEQKNFPAEEKRGQLRLIAAKDARDGAVKVYQDLDLYASVLEKGDVVTFEVQRDRYAWLHVAQGVATVNGKELKAGDGVQVSGEETLEISSNASGEILLFDLG